MSDDITVYISESSITVPSASLLVADTPAAVAGFRFAIFRWNQGEDIRPNNWQVRSKIGSGAWDYDWTAGEGKTVNNWFVRALDAGSTDGDTITIEVRSIDGTGAYTTTKTNNVATLAFADLTTALPLLSVDTAQLANLAVSTGKIALLAVDTAQLAALGVTAAKLAPDAVETDKIKNLNVTTGKIALLAVDTDQLAAGAVTLAKLANNSVAGAQVVNGSITHDKITPGDLTVTELGATVIAMMFDSGGRAKLDTALTPLTINTLNTDNRLLYIGTGENITVNRVAAKAALGVALADGETSATIRAAITDANLIATTTAVLGANVITAINAATGAIANTKLALVKPAAIGHTIASDMFDSSGRLLTGVYSVTARTAAAIIASMDTLGNSLLWDPTSWKVGTDTADILVGNINAAAQFVKADEKIAIGYLSGHVHTNGANKVGVYDGAATTTPAQIYAGVQDTIQLWNNYSSAAAGGTTITPLIVAATGGTWKEVYYRIAVRYCASWQMLRFRINALASNAIGTNEFRIQVRDTGLVSKDIGIVSEVGAVISAANDQYEATLDISAGLAGVSDGDLINIDIDCYTLAADTMTITEAVLTAER